MVAVVTFFLNVSFVHRADKVNPFLVDPTKPTTPGGTRRISGSEIFGVTAEQNLPTARAPIVSNRPAMEPKASPFNPFAPRAQPLTPTASVSHVSNFVSNSGASVSPVTVQKATSNPFPEEEEEEEVEEPLSSG